MFLYQYRSHLLQVGLRRSRVQEMGREMGVQEMEKGRENLHGIGPRKESWSQIVNPLKTGTNSDSFRCSQITTPSLVCRTFSVTVD